MLNTFCWCLRFIIFELNIILNNDFTYRFNYILDELNLFMRGSEEEERETEYDEENENNISFNEEDDENIILENNNIFKVNVNIKDLIQNDEKQKID